MKIYKITNTANEKVYVGQTIQSLAIRWRLHLHHATSKQYPLYQAMRKHGTDNFSVTMLEELPDDCNQEELDAAEIKWIIALNSLVPHGYNIKPGGEGRFKMTIEHKLAISEAKKRQWANVEKTDEIREKMRQKALGNQNRRGKAASEETRAKISEVQKGRKASDETRAKMSAAHKKRLAEKRLAENRERSPAQLEALAKAREKLKGKAPWNKGRKGKKKAKKT